VTRQRSCIFLVVALWTAPGLPQEEPTASSDAVIGIDPTTIYSNELEFAARVGRMIYTKLRLADEAEEAAELILDQSTGARSLGSVVVAQEGRWVVRFVGSTGRRLVSFYDVEFSADGVPRVQAHDPPQALTPDEVHMFLAKQAAREALPFRCGDGRYGVAVLPSPAGKGWAVYLLARSSESDRLVVGGHFRAAVSPNGKKLKAIEALTGRCLESPTTAGSRDDEASEAVWIMHSSFPTPAEAHVVLSLVHPEVPIYVGTWTGAWALDDGQIEFAFDWQHRGEERGLRDAPDSARTPGAPQGETLPRL